MSDQQGDDEQRRDKLLLRLLKMPPQSRADTAERVRRAKGKAPQKPKKRTPSARKRSLRDGFRGAARLCGTTGTVFGLDGFG
jgi:hypothetical protein